MAYTTIDNPELYFQTKLYTGNGSTQSITGVGFTQDFTWIKIRSETNHHRFLDTVRGATKELYSEFFPDVPIYTMTSDESESVKYFANCFLATKVMFFNEMKVLTESLGVDFDKIGEAVTADTRIADSHWKVPGPDGD